MSRSPKRTSMLTVGIALVLRPSHPKQYRLLPCFHTSINRSHLFKSQKISTTLLGKASDDEEPCSDTRKIRKSKNRKKDWYSNRYNQKQRVLGQFSWLEQTSLNLLDEDLYPLGSMKCGKWHELHSMMTAWAKFYFVFITSLSEITSTFPHASIDLPPVMIESLLKRAIEEKSFGNTDVTITTHMYNIAIEAWAVTASSGHNSTFTSFTQSDIVDSRRKIENPRLFLSSAERSLDIVKCMQLLHESDGDKSIKPNAYTFVTALGALVKACSSSSNYSQDIASDAAQRAHEMLLWMDELARSGRNIEACPTVLSYSLVMDAHAKSRDRDAGKKAESLLRHMQKQGKLRPNTLCYNIVINAYTRQERRGGAVDDAERILNELEEVSRSSSDKSLFPDVVSYTSVISAWANSNRKAFGAQRAEDIMVRMAKMATDTCDPSIEPNTVTFNAVLKAWCRSDTDISVHKSLSLFRKMENDYFNGNENVKPDRITFNTLLHTLAKSCKKESAELAEKILIRMESYETEGVMEWSPNLFSYNTCIEAWSKIPEGNGALQSYSILQKLMIRNNDRRIEPDSYSFNSVIFALSKSKLKDAPFKAEEILRFMDSSHKKGTLSVGPDVVTFSAAIHAWSQHSKKDSGVRAEKLLDEMETRYTAGEKKLKPNTVTYNSVIDAWAKAGMGVTGARKAELLLKRMELLNGAGDEDIKPNARSYKSVLEAWARSDTKCAHWKTQSVLKQMWDLYDAGNKDVRPDSLAYNMWINAVSKSQRVDKAQKALRILREMDRLYRKGLNRDARPNEFTYTSVLNSCAFSVRGDEKIRKKALDTAIFTLKELLSSPYGKPNHVTYGVFFKAVANLMQSDDERRRIVLEPIFLQCCKDGQVGEIVLTQLKNAAPADLYVKLLGGSRVTVDDLPREWSCNVQPDHRRNRFRSYRKHTRVPLGSDNFNA